MNKVSVAFTICADFRVRGIVRMDKETYDRCKTVIGSSKMDAQTGRDQDRIAIGLFAKTRVDEGVFEELTVEEFSEISQISAGGDDDDRS